MASESGRSSARLLYYTEGFQAWRKGITYDYDQWRFTFFVVLLTLLKANFKLAFRSWEQLTLWWRRCHEDLGV